MSNTEAWRKQAAEQIRALTPQPAGLTKVARFREVYPELEDAMQRGISQAELVATLAATGLAMTLDELRNALYRERKRLKRAPTPNKEPRHEAQNPAPPQTAAAPGKPGQFDWQTHRDTKPNW